MAKESRSAVREFYNLSERLKKYGDLITILDVDGEDNVWCVGSRGRYKIYLEFKAATLEDGIFEAPLIPYYQLADGWWNLYPYFLVFYSAEKQGEFYDNYWYYVAPLNYAGIAYLDSVDRVIMTEEEFQKFLVKLSPCNPSAQLSKYKPKINKFFYWNKTKGGDTYLVNKNGIDLYDTYEKIGALVSKFGEGGRYKDADNKILDAVDPVIYGVIRAAYRKIKEVVEEKYFEK